MKIHLATFYSSDLKRSAKRFKKQAEDILLKVLFENMEMLMKKEILEEIEKIKKTILDINV